MSITAVLNTYLRLEVLDTQVEAILNQTVKPDKIFIQDNSEGRADLSKYKNDDRFVIHGNGENVGVWQRFIISGTAETDFVCVFDDDTIPGNRWFENCIETMKKVNGLLGTIGIIFWPSMDSYRTKQRIGWDGPCTTVVDVDTVGHSWFFRPEWIDTFTKYIPTGENYHRLAGEDMHFTYVLQKYLGLKTYVPPHPEDDKSLWGSNPETARKYGMMEIALYRMPGSYERFDKAYKYYRENGLKVLCDIVNLRNSLTHIEYFLELISKKLPFAVIRPNDGEYLILTGKKFTNTDNWTFSGGSLQTDLYDAIAEATKLTGTFIGIPCPDCYRQVYEYYLNTFKIPEERLTYGNLVANTNWKRFTSYLINNKTPFYYVGPGLNTYEPLNVLDRFFIDEYLLQRWDEDGVKTDVIDRLQTWVQSKPLNSLFMFSAGPLSKIFITKLVKLLPMNQYLDCGSSLDIFLKGRTNRPYINDPNSQYAQMVCSHHNGHTQMGLRFNPAQVNPYFVPESSRGGVCIDIGTNCGTFSHKYADFFSKIHYYEPVKSCFTKCTERLAQYPHVIGFQEAVLDTTGKKVNIHMYKNADSGSCAVKNTDVMENSAGWTSVIEYDISTISLQDAITRTGSEIIDYLKIDCETSEYPILYGQDLSKIKHIGIEIHNQIGLARWTDLIGWLKTWFDIQNEENVCYSTRDHNLLYLKNRLYN